MTAIAVVSLALGSQGSMRPMRIEDLKALLAQLPPELRLSPQPTEAWSLLTKLGGRNVPKSSEIFRNQDESTWFYGDWKNVRTKEQWDRAGAIVAAFEPRIALVEQALRVKKWGMPFDVAQVSRLEHITSDLEGLSGSKQIGKVLIRKARLQIHRGQSAQAARSLRLVIKLGRKIQSIEGTTVTYLTGDAIVGMARQEAIELSRNPKVSSEESLSLVRALEDPWNRSAALRALRGDLCRGLLPFIALAVNQPLHFTATEKAIYGKHPEPISAKKTLDLAIRLTRLQMRSIKQPWGGLEIYLRKRRELLRDAPRQLESIDVTKLTPNAPKTRELARQLQRIENPLGLLLLAVAFSGEAESGFAKIPFLIAARTRATQLVIAAHNYRRRTAQWPRTLSDLTIQDGIPKPLMDPFSGRPFQYDRKRLAIWSVGPKGDSNPEDRLTFHLVSR